MDERLKFLEKLKLQLKGFVKVGEKKEPGWKTPIPLYAFNCQTHGLVNGTPRGYENRLVCPLCEEESENARSDKTPITISG